MKKALILIFLIAAIAGIAFAFGGEDAQRKLLEAEGVGFLPDGKVDMKKYSWI